jgi:hypothetical protein
MNGRMGRLADCVFGQLPQDMFVAMLPNVVGLLAHESSVVHSYAAHCIERMLMVKDAGQPRFVSANLAPVLTQLLTNLFGKRTLQTHNCSQISLVSAHCR